MKVLVAYVAVSKGPITQDYCARFVGSYLANPPGVTHETVICCNGGALPTETALLFLPLAPQFYLRDNDPGYDVSAYLDVANKFDCDLLCCLGESCYFHKPGWLKRMVEARERFGPGIYGFFSAHSASAHLNTTGFCVDPKYLRGYPKVTNHAERYEFEHGKTALWRRVRDFGGATMLITWDGEWRSGQWRIPKNILWRGDQSNCLIYCNHSDRYYAADPLTKARWAQKADSPFV